MNKEFLHTTPTQHILKLPKLSKFPKFPNLPKLPKFPNHLPSKFLSAMGLASP